MTSEEVIEIIQDHIDEAEMLSERRVAARTDRERYRDALQKLRDEDIKHITTITGTDMGEEMELIYHISCDDGILLDLKIEIPMEDGKVPTITDIFPGALLYEREIQDLLGVEFEGHPDPRRLILPDDWPDNKYPLRQEKYEYEEIAKQTVSEVKEIAGDEDFDYERMLEAEKENQNRKSLIGWLEGQIEKSEGE